MPLEISVIRKEDKVILKFGPATMAVLEAEEALEIAKKITIQSDKILAATGK